MPETNDQYPSNDPFPAQVRCAVSSKNQFQLPAAFVSEVGFQSSTAEVAHGAKVAWYSHEADDKAVLASDKIDRPSVELVGVCRLAGISNDALAAGDVEGARLTIISELPDPLYERLTRGSVVLNPIYAGRHSELDATCVSVYPAREYDHGLLPNVDRELREIEGDDGSVRMEAFDSHANSI
jgi:hypothetical protein